MADRSRRRFVRTEVVSAILRDALAARVEATGRGELDVVDVGGGTGGFAVPLAAQGHRVLVVDGSPDALASLGRRAADDGASDRVRGVLGDAEHIADIAGEDSADLVLCHSVLELVADPLQVLAQAARTLRAGGLLSVLAANRHAVAIARALGGHIHEARHALDDPHGRWGPGDPLPRRFGVADLRGLVEGAGLHVETVHGIRVFADLVPGSLADEPGVFDALCDLEMAAAQHAELLAVATQIHILAVRS